MQGRRGYSALVQPYVVPKSLNLGVLIYSSRDRFVFYAESQIIFGRVWGVGVRVAALIVIF